MEVYIPQRQNMVTQYIPTHLIMGVYGEAERRTGLQVSKMWCKQGVIALEGSRLIKMVAET